MIQIYMYANIMNMQIFHLIKYDLKGNWMSKKLNFIFVLSFNPNLRSYGQHFVLVFFYCAFFKGPFLQCCFLRRRFLRYTKLSQSAYTMYLYILSIGVDKPRFCIIKTLTWFLTLIVFLWWTRYMFAPNLLLAWNLM